MLLLFSLLLAYLQRAVQDFVALPPAILVGPPPEVIFFTGSIKLECYVSGHPFPTITWMKDNGILNTNKDEVLLQSDRQFLKITIRNDSVREHEGNYSCLVENKFGKIFSNTSIMVEAVSAQGGGIKNGAEANVGEAMVLKYLPMVASIPKSSIVWKTKNGHAIVLDHRIQMSDEGDLHFAYAVKDDQRFGGGYKADTFNKPMDTIVGTSYYTVKILGDSASMHPPSLVFHSPKNVAALEGKNFTLRCFFSGYPTPQVSWSKLDDKIPADRSHRGISWLTIANASKEDGGQYVCSGNNTTGIETYKIYVSVEASPKFLSWDDAPFDQNKTVGDDAVFKCLGQGDPQPHREWFVNGVYLSDSPQRKVSVSSDQSVLTMRNLCKRCEDGHHDLKVVQCKLSNKYGNILVAGYINVLDKTEAHLIGNADVTLLEEEEKTLTYRCGAKHDPSTEAKIKWMRLTSTPKYSVFYGSYYETEEYELLSNEPPHIEVTNQGRLTLQRRKRDTLTWSKIGSKFKCVVTNGYSADEKIVRINISDSPLAFRRGMISWWWLLVLFVVLMMIIIAVVVCCLKYMKQKGNEYDVDAREKLNGNEPEKELMNHGFSAYKRPDDLVYLRSSKASLGSSGHCSEEDESLNDYGLAEGSKFNEDGSFVGAYVPNPKMAQTKSKREYVSSPLTRYYT